MNEVLDYVRKDFAFATTFYDELVANYVTVDSDLALQRFERFKQLHSAIWAEQTEIKQRFVLIGAILAEIRRDDLYKSVCQPAHGKTGYNNFYTFCQDVFGFKKTTVVNLLSVYDNFCNKQSGLLNVEYINFSYSQLLELSRMDNYRERISVTTSVRDIRKLREYYKTNTPKPGNTIADDLADYKAQQDEEKRIKNLEKSKINLVPAKSPTINGENSDGQTSDHLKIPSDLGENADGQTSDHVDGTTNYNDDRLNTSSSGAESFDDKTVINALLNTLNLLKTNAPEWARFCECASIALNKGDPGYFALRRDYVALEIENADLKDKIEKLRKGVKK
jgi:hypothetical protein